MQEKRFGFGKNWRSFLDTMSEERISFAVDSLKEMLKTDNLKDKTFLDIGCGSGLFSLAALRMGAKVYSFDYDKESVDCALTLRNMYKIPQENWQIKQGSVLDGEYMNSLGKFDIVYSWGVLHHTGQLALAMTNASMAAKDNSLLYIAVYNDQGLLSFLWKKVKQIYCFGVLGRIFISVFFIPALFLRSVLSGIVKNKDPFFQFKFYKRNRGMSLYHDWVDWLGGYPYETASAEEVKSFYSALGFELFNLKTTNSWGCNEFVFAKR